MSNTRLQKTVQLKLDSHLKLNRFSTTMIFLKIVAEKTTVIAKRFKPVAPITN